MTADEPQEFFPFDPRRLRWGLVIILLLSAVPLGLAVRSARAGEGLPAFLRIGLCAGISLASGVVAWRLRPRPGWGVALTPEGLRYGRSGKESPIVVPWHEIEVARPVGPERKHLVVLWGQGRRLVLSPALFAGEARFLALAVALEKRLPRPVLDA